MNYGKHQQRSGPRLDRRNANKNINYDASDSPSSTSSSFDDSSSLHRRLRSLEQFSERTSFRVEGIDGEFDLICRSLGLSGPEDFSIPIAAWEASKASSPSGNFRSSRFRDNFGDGNLVDNDQLSNSFAASVTVREEDGDEFRPGNDSTELRTAVNVVEFENDELHRVIGFRPPKLAPPPVLSQRPVDNMSSTWDIFRDFGPPVDEGSNQFSRSREGNEMMMGQHDVAEVPRDRPVVSESCSDSSNDEDYTDDNSFNLAAESVCSILPHVTSRRTINSWQKGDFLGSGSFGTVYEGFTE